MPSQLPIVQIKRGMYSSSIQLTRAWISAASALITESPGQSICFIDRAIVELTQLKVHLGGTA